MTNKYLKRLSYIFIGLNLIACSLPSQISAQSLSTSSWMKTSDPQLGLVKELDQAQYQNNSRECIPDTKFITVTRDIILSRTEKSHLACATPTAFGYHDSQTGEIMLTGSSVSGKIQTYEGGYLSVQPLPNRDSVMYFNSQEPLYGSYRYIIDDFSKKIDVIQQPNGTIIHKLRMKNPGIGIKDSSDKLINFSGSHFSSDTQWMIGNAHMRGMFRINMVTGENLIYGGGYNHAIGMSPSFVSATSSSGRYAIDTENRYGIFRIYDFETCVRNSDPLKPANCQYRDLTSFINSRIPTFQRVLKAEFSSDYTIRLTIQLSNNTYRHYTLTAHGERESLLDYLALGDSFASGEGAGRYKPATDTRNLNTCHLSPASYPYLPPIGTGLNGVESIACSGAKVKDIFNDNYHEGTAQAKEKNDPSYDQEIYTQYLPGYRPQSEFTKRTKPKNATLSIGGNDINFSRMILECLQPGTCFTNPQERLDIAHTINQQFNGLVSTYQKLKNETRADGTVYVIGYPSIVADGGNCAINVLLNAEEIKFSNHILKQLNSVIEAAAKKAGVVYVNTTDALRGYRLCEIERQESAVNGGMLGDDKTFSYVLMDKYLIEGYFTNSGSYHPNARGHQLLAEFISRTTNEFSKSNPEKQTTPTPSLDDMASFLPENYASLNPNTIVSDANMTHNLLSADKSNLISLSGFKPSSEVRVRIGSVDLGKFTTDNNGDVSTNFTIPPSLLGSVQTLHATGKNNSGEGIDKQKIVYVTDNPATTIPTDIFKEFTPPDNPKLDNQENKIISTLNSKEKTPATQISSITSPVVARTLIPTLHLTQNSPIHAYNYGAATLSQVLGKALEQPTKLLSHFKHPNKQSLKTIVIALVILTLITLLTRIIRRKRLQYSYLE